jgi:hypothetical protein
MPLINTIDVVNLAHTRHTHDQAAREGTQMARPKSETRQLTAGVYVRFTPAQLDQLRSEAESRSVSVQQLLRERSLGPARAAS